MNPKGIIMRPSPYTVKETIDRLVVFLQQHGATVYARINQQSELNNAGLQISPLELILFGNPKLGGLVMMVTPMAALDLPLKIIVWEDETNAVWLAHTDAVYLGERYNLPHALITSLDPEPLITKALTK
jgi:uncharacterized protein (DUF302 family)